MDLKEIFWGSTKDLGLLPMVDRSIVVFFITLILIRMAGMRAFGKKTAFDSVVVIILGAVLSRAIVGASSFWSTVAAATVIVLIHRFVAWVSLKSLKIEKWIKGKDCLLFEDGTFDEENMHRTAITKMDMMQSVRRQIHVDSFDEVKKIYIENTGELTVIRK